MYGCSVIITDLRYRLAEQLRACSTEDNLTDCYGVLKDLQYLILQKRDECSQLTPTAGFMLHRIDTELDCIKYRIEHEDLRRRLPTRHIGI